MAVKRVTITNEPGVYECFPDVVATPSGRLVLAYRESDSHAAGAFSHLPWRISDDGGETWCGKRYLVRSAAEDGVLWKWNCPRLSLLGDGRLALVCDHYPQPPGERYGRQPPVVYVWFSCDDGETWDGPHPTAAEGIVPDRIVELRDGAWLLAAHRGFAPKWRLVQRLWRSEDRGATWQGPHTVGKSPRLNLCEAAIVETPGGELVAYMRENSGQGWPIYKALSADGGRTWDGPWPTLMDGGHRPTAGLLPSGRMLITYRYLPGIGIRSLNTFACAEPLESALERDRGAQTATILPLDRDRSPASDSGYTGWAILPDRRTIFVVNYIVDDADSAQIRGYWLTEDDL
jgi:sialidase-1